MALAGFVCVKPAPTLKRLHLPGNAIGFKGAMAFVKACEVPGCSDGLGGVCRYVSFGSLFLAISKPVFEVQYSLCNIFHYLQD